MMSSTQIKPFDYELATAAEWDQWLSVRRTMARDLNPHDPLIAPDLERKATEAMSRDLQNNFRRYLALKDDQVVGLLTLNLPVQQNGYVATTCVYVVPEQRREGIGRLLLQQAAAECQAHGITLLQGESSSSASHAFAMAFGATVGSQSQEKRLSMSAVNEMMLEQWTGSASRKNPDFTIHTFTGLFSEDATKLACYAHLYTEIANQAPFEELEGTGKEFTVYSLRIEDQEHKQMGITLLTKVIIAPDATLCGLTEISYHPEWSGRAVQGLTGVREPYRGRGLGKWLKADMLQTIRRQYPSVAFISTLNANVNAPMQAINGQLGFRLHNQRTTYKLPVAELLTKLPVA